MKKALPSRPRSVSKSRPASGFSLIELLITVGIIAVLATLIVPAVQGAFKNSRQAKCVANLRQLASGCILYSQDHDGGLPYAVNAGSWHRLIYPYLKTDSPDTQAWGKEQWQENIQKEKYYICPSDQTPYSDMLSYAWNKKLRSNINEQPYRVQRGGSYIMLAEGESYAFDLSDKTGLEFRHSDKGNFAYTDGHIVTYASTEPMDEHIKVEF